MKFDYAPDTISVATAIVPHETGFPHEIGRLNTAEGEQARPDCLAITPKGRVPALVTDHGSLTETGAILDDLATLAPQAGLLG